LASRSAPAPRHHICADAMPIHAGYAVWNIGHWPLPTQPHSFKDKEVCKGSIHPWEREETLKACFVLRSQISGLSDSAHIRWLSLALVAMRIGSRLKHKYERFNALEDMDSMTAMLDGRTCHLLQSIMRT
jgi:hypothetical protein